MNLSGTFAVAQKFTWGVKAGSTLSLNSFRDKEDKNTFTAKEKIGYFGALLINIPLKKNYSLQTELGLSQRGRRLAFNSDSSINNASYNFLDATLVARKSFPVTLATYVKGNWFLNAGPRISYWRKGTGKVTGTNPLNYDIIFGTTPTVIDASKLYLTDVNRLLFALDIGVGLDVPIKRTHDLLIEFRYSHGFVPYGKRNSAYNATPGFDDSLKALERVLSLSVGYTLFHDLKKAKKGKSTKQERRRTKPRKEFDSLIR